MRHLRRILMCTGIAGTLVSCKMAGRSDDGAGDIASTTPLPTNSAVEHRCGWIDNPTPANWWLNDKDGQWIISSQGANNGAAGMDLLPDFGNRWIRTNGYYGYGCGCVDAKVDASGEYKRVTEIVKAEVKDINVCQTDSNLTPRDPMEGVETTICGWIDNPTPANWWLTDKFGNWTISAQGGHHADGEAMPDFGANWVKTNGSYGYGCACLNAHVSRSTWTVNRVSSVKVQKLNVCQTDPNIPRRAVKKKTLNFCGWLVNPTPANWSLVDKFGRWTIAVQGGYQAPGSENLQHTPEWKRVNGNYGYGCGCMAADVDDSYATNRRVYKMNSFKAQPLKVCQDDSSLKPWNQ
jgi:Protein of unknown function (DUF4087)